MKNSELPMFPVEVNPDEKKGIVGKQKSNFSWFEIGLTKREYFAAMAMQGYCGGEYTGQSGMPHEQIANWSVKMADALLAELEKTKQ